eukprot:CAMPEP_0170168366 /NCGR_PEP_ID=MMETSP0040_2-20121228/1435_1 /TAXON_ID=641309 /ORGANISM="Lotharella oceanica, Strain CCMP622" /LENGTH=139 /DNA_ID=CAMNT_0010406601 /DNA_START=22 /DNA_END=441 /DNA_ORIENTATION=-
MAEYHTIADSRVERPQSMLRFSLAANVLLGLLVCFALFFYGSDSQELGHGLTRGAITSRVAPTISRSQMAPRSTSVQASKKGDRLMVTLECTEARPAGKIASRYTTVKNRKNTPDRMEMMKYNKFLRRHTLHREIKKSK